jgi:transcriptional regulator GlxA family with amidase domain
MKNVAIIIPEGPSVLASIIGTYHVFARVNEYMVNHGQSKCFSIQMVGLSNEVSLHEGLFAVHPDVVLSNAQKADLVIIPALLGDISVSLKRNKDFIPWIASQYKCGAEVASLCTGAFILASTGILKGKTCSTHWLMADVFRQMFPDVKMIAEKIITDQHGVYSSGGAYSFLNLILYLIEKYCGREMAVFCAKIFEIDIERNTQSPFTIFQGQKDHEDEEIKKAQQFIENSVSEKISIDQLSSMFAISRRNFERRFKKATANSPVEYIQRVKVEAAKKSLESSRENVNDVMYAVGYSDSKAFRNVFKRITGLSPLEYRQKYNREIITI